MNKLISVVVVVAWAFGTGYLLFKVQSALQPGGIRSSAEEEIAGLDATEMGVLAYPDFTGSGPLGEGDLGEVPLGPSHPTHATRPVVGSEA